MDAELLLELDLELEQDPVRVGGLGDQAGELPEVGLLLAGGRAERGRVDGADALGEDAEAAAAEDLAGVVADLLEVGGALDEDVGDGEGVVEGERGVVAALADLLGPDLGRDVDQQAAAVALAVDVAGAVEHLLERLQRQRDRLVARRRVLADRGVDRAGVLVLDATAARPAGDRPAQGNSAASLVPPGFRAFFERARDGVGPTERMSISGGAQPIRAR